MTHLNVAQNWGPGQPDNHGGIENAVFINQVGIESAKVCHEIKTIVWSAIIWSLVSLAFFGFGLFSIRTFNARLLDIHWIGAGATCMWRIACQESSLYPNVILPFSRLRSRDGRLDRIRIRRIGHYDG